MKRRKFAFRWKLGEVRIDHTWAYSEEEVWERAIELCRPAALKRASVRRVREYLEQHGEVYEIDEKQS